MDGPVPMDPELVWSGMAFLVDDPSQAGAEAADLWLEAETSGPTDGTDWAAVALDVNGDVQDDYWLETPDEEMVKDEVYETPVWKVVSGKLTSTGVPAFWVRSESTEPDGFNGYDAWFNWKKLRLTKVRYAFILEDSTEAFDVAPDDFTGALLSLPQPPKAPTSVKAVAGTYAATVSWARPSSAYEVLDYKVLAYDAAGKSVGKSCTVKAPALKCTVSGLKTATNYRFRVVARSDAGTSARSNYSNTVVPKPRVRIALKAVDSGNKLFVDVDPNLAGTRYWSFRVQKKVNGRWTLASRTYYSTQTSRETRTLDLRKGTYRVVVYAKYGYSTTYAPTSVYLRR